MRQTPVQQHLFSDLTVPKDAERVDGLAEGPAVRIERIVSDGHSTPEGQWYDQPLDEWVLLLTGSAVLEIEGESTPRPLRPGDALLLPKGCRHRVRATDLGEKTVWLAVHGCFEAPAS